MIPHRLLSHSALSTLVGTLCLVASTAAAQVSSPAPLPPAAAEALDKGIMAAREQSYEVALRYMNEARRASPQEPQIFRSLGAVESRLPGRELRAMAWYGAYLAAMPNAPDAADVRKEIARLEVRNQMAVAVLIKQVYAAADGLSDTGNTGSDRNFALSDVVTLWLGAGDIAEAEKIAAGIRSADYKSRAMLNIADAKVKAGDVAGAKRDYVATARVAVRIGDTPSAGLTSSEYNENQSLAFIALGQVRAGDVLGAKRTAGLVSDKYVEPKLMAVMNIVDAEVKTGDIPAAKKTLASAQAAYKAAIDGEGYPVFKSSVRNSIAGAEIMVGDIERARQTLAAAVKTAILIEPPQYRAQQQSLIARLQARAGDLAAARNTLLSALQSAELAKNDADKVSVRVRIAAVQEEVGDAADAGRMLASAEELAQSFRGDGPTESQALWELAAARAKAGDIPVAREHAARIRDELYRGFANQAISEAEAKAGTINLVSAWIGNLDDSDGVNDGALNTGPVLDLKAHLQSLFTTNLTPDSAFRAIHKPAAELVKAQSIVSGRLKAQFAN